MSVDLVLRAIASLTCMYTAGLFVTLASIATINAAGYDPYCTGHECQTASVERQYITPVRSISVGVKPIAMARVEQQKI
jgi:hypothetical protein